MKLKNFILISCLLGAGFLHLSAQNQNAAQQEWFETSWWDLPVYCDEVLVDWISNYVTVHWVSKLDKEGNWKWDIISFKGEGTSLSTGEKFKYKEFDKLNSSDNTWTWRYNLKGEWGTKYIGVATQDLTTGNWEPGHCVCK